ncbi:MAG: hypothetical protein GY869_00775, partial [Planctomycetes bacterium]|nr:hypothetical protein [Planctomycetota bacterium]
MILSRTFDLEGSTFAFSGSLLCFISLLFLLFASVSICPAVPVESASEQTQPINSHALLFFDDFPTTILDSLKWTGLMGQPTADDLGINEPSLHYSLHLNGYPQGAEAIESRIIDLSGYDSAELTYWHQIMGGGDMPELNEDLVVQYFDGSSWREINRHLGGNPGMNYYQQSIITLPHEALHPDFQMRFYRTPGSVGAYDDWFVDDITLNGIIADDLSITPQVDFESLGITGGPFTPSFQTYRLANDGNAAINWTSNTSDNWLAVSRSSGLLNPLEFIDVNVWITPQAELLDAGDYQATFTVTNLTSSLSQQKNAILIIKGPLIFADDFPSTTLDHTKWPSTNGAPAIDDVGINEPSPPYALRLNGQPSGSDTVISQILDLSYYNNAQLTYWHQRTGGGESPESGDDLTVQYWNGYDWLEIDRQPGDGPDMITFEKATVPLPPMAFHDQFKFMFKNFGHYVLADDWFVDNIAITSNILDHLLVTPEQDMLYAGSVGGPFNSANNTYSLANTGNSTIEFSISTNQTWLSMTPDTGAINPGAAIDITVQTNSQANQLPRGEYHAVITFNNNSTNVQHSRQVLLAVGLKTILAYTEFADGGVNGEYTNTLNALDSINPAYSLNELNDFSQLDTLLPSYQVLLIPYQKNATFGQLESIGAAWGPALRNFLDNAGVIIQCDYADRYGILTGAGLLDVTTYSDVTLINVDVVAGQNPIAWGLPSFYRAQQGSSTYQTSEQTVVVAKPNIGAVVINKEISWGNVVLIGHNFQDSHVIQNRLLSNAVYNLPAGRDSLQISPPSPFSSFGPQGGPFNPGRQSYTLTNIGSTPLPWQITYAASWLDFDVTSGTLDPGAAIVINAFINHNANLLPLGAHTGQFTIKNLNTNATQNRSSTIQVAAKYILAYTEFADASYNQTYQKTLEALRSVNPDFAVIELNDYAQLESDLSKFDALLIPLQKFADNQQLNAIGAAWKPILTNYIEQGGILIQCDSDNKFGILTGAGLMDISAGVNSTSSTLFVTDPDDPINHQVPDSYISRENSSYYLTSEKNVMVENPSYGPVVINKDIRLGNAVLIGHDFLHTNAAQSQLIANAVFNLPSARDNLKVTPREQAFAMGPVHGPFYPNQFYYTLTNVGFTAFDWTTPETADWFTVSPDAGSLEPNQSIDLTVSVNSNANTLAKNAYQANIFFENTATGYTVSRNINLTVGYKHILTYTEFAVNPDYQNSLNAIQSTNPEFLVTELNDYTQLDNVLLPIHDVILIPDQQYASANQLENIGAAWETTLKNFIYNGGVVIQCDNNQKYGILTGAGLMNIQNSANFMPDPNGLYRDIVEVVAPNHPIALNVPDSYIALPHSSWYHTAENTSVIQYPGFGPVVIDKQLGAGDVVLIGHDYYTNYYLTLDRVLGNAVFNLPSPRDDLSVFPDELFAAAGPKEGPYQPSSNTYTLTNLGNQSLDWLVNFNTNWLEAIPSAGSLNPGESLDVEILLTTNANQLLAGLHYADIIFQNLTSNASLMRPASIAVGHKKILVYRQYADNQPQGRLEHTIDAIASVGSNFLATDLLIYQDLETLLPGHDILLIPRQILANQSQMESIGALWADTLQRFIHNGGVMILCDSYSTFGILNGAGLMDIENSSAALTEFVEIIAPDDPLTRGLPNTFPAMFESASFITQEKSSVAKILDNPDPVVFNKPIGLGNVILIGHDYKESNNAQDRLVGNAVFNLPSIFNDLNITPKTDFCATGTIGGPFTPTQNQYTITNIGSAPLDWEITESISWLDIDFTSGSLPPGQSTTVTASLNDTTLILPAQIHSEPIYLINQNTGEIQARQATLKIITPTLFYDDFPTNIIDLSNWTNLSGAPTVDSVGINEPSPPYALRLNGDPFGFDAVTSKPIDLTLYDQVDVSYWYQRTGGGEAPEYAEDLVISYWNTADWIILEKWSGIGPDMNDFNQSTITLPPEAILPEFRLKIASRGTAGPYDDWFVDDVKIVGTLLDELVVLPKNDLVTNGPVGGPFNPTQLEYTITNLGTYPLDFSIDESIPWLDLNLNSTSIAPGQSINVIAAVNATAQIMDPDFHQGTITFHNLTNQKIQHRTVILEVMGPTIFFDDFPDMTFNPINWTGFSGVPTIDAEGIAEPSPPYALRLNGNPDGSESVETRFIDLSFYGQAELSYWYQRTGGGEDPDLNEDLIVQFWD